MAETSKNKIYYNNDENSVADVPTDMKKMAESTDEAIEKSKYNDAAIKKSISDVEKKQVEKNIEQDSKILELQTEKAKLETELKEMQEDFYQASIRGQASGEYIHVEDSNNCRAKIGIGGNHEQETSIQTENYVDDRESRGKTISQATSLYLPIVNLKSGDNYYFKIFDKDNQILQDSRYLAVEFYDVNKTKIQDGPLGFPKSFTEEAVTKIKYAKIYYNGNDTDKAIGNTVIKKIGLKITSNESADDIDLFVPNMPSTDYLSEIKTVGSGGSVKVTKCNKNILPLENKTSEWDKAKISIINNELTIKPNSSGNLPVVLDGNVYPFSLNKGTTITMSWVYKNGDLSLDTGAIGVDLKLDYDDGTTNSLRAGDIVKANQKSTSSQTITLEKNVKSIHWYVFGWNVTNAKGSSTYNLQLEIGSKATSSEQHEEQLYIMPVQKEMLEGDYFDYDNEEEVHTWNKYGVTGNENWITASSDFSSEKIYSAYLSVSDMEEKSKIYSTHFKNIIDTTKQYIYVPYSNILVVGISKDIASDVTVFKNYLKSQYDAGTPVIIYYKLQTPTRLKFTDEQKAVAKELTNARTYKNVTNLTTDSKAILSLDYAKDLETLLNNTQALAVSNASEGV